MSKISETASRLYEAAEKMRDVKGQSAVARLLGVSPQVMKNWESRGVSESGALLAQQYIGCDANWVLCKGGPMKLDTSYPSVVSIAAERAVTYNQASWPFVNVTPQEWNRLIYSIRMEMETKIKDAIKIQELTQQTAQNKS